MKRHIGLGILVLLAAPVAAAEKEDVAAAAKQLADKENYSWNTTTESPQGGANRFRPGPSEGKTEKGGYTTLKFTFGENTVEAVLKGDKGAIKSEEGWQSLAEAAQGDGQQNRARFFARMLQNQRTPAVQAADLASKTKELKKADDAIAGDLTEQGAKDLLTFRRRGGDDTAGPEISGAKGTVKFWIKDGVLTKYQHHVQGTVKFNDQEREVDRTTTVEIKDVGKTKVEVPDEAKTKSS